MRYVYQRNIERIQANRNLNVAIMHTIRASESPSAIAASLKPPPLKGIDDSHEKKTSGSLVQPDRCTRQPASNNAQLSIYTQ